MYIFFFPYYQLSFRVGLFVALGFCSSSIVSKKLGVDEDSTFMFRTLLLGFINMCLAVELLFMLLLLLLLASKAESPASTLVLEEECGITEGSLERRAPRLHDMEGKSGGICQIGNDGPDVPFCGVFQPKLRDLVGDEWSWWW